MPGRTSLHCRKICRRLCRRSWKNLGVRTRVAAQSSCSRSCQDYADLMTNKGNMVITTNIFTTIVWYYEPVWPGPQTGSSLFPDSVRAAHSPILSLASISISTIVLSVFSKPDILIPVNIYVVRGVRKKSHFVEPKP